MISVNITDAPPALQERRLLLFGPIEDTECTVETFRDMFRRCLAKLAAKSSGSWVRLERFGGSELSHEQARWIAECLVAYGYIECKAGLRCDVYRLTDKGRDALGR